MKENGLHAVKSGHNNHDERAMEYSLAKIILKFLPIQADLYVGVLKKDFAEIMGQGWPGKDLANLEEGMRAADCLAAAAISAAVDFSRTHGSNMFHVRKRTLQVPGPTGSVTEADLARIAGISERQLRRCRKGDGSTNCVALVMAAEQICWAKAMVEMQNRASK